MSAALKITRTKHTASDLCSAAGQCRDGAQVRRLLALGMVLNGPDPAIHGVVRWRCLDLRDEVARRCRVTVHKSTIGRWLHQLGLIPARQMADSSGHLTGWYRARATAKPPWRGWPVAARKTETHAGPR